MLVMVVLLPVRRLPKNAMVGCAGKFSGQQIQSPIGPAIVFVVLPVVRMLQLLLAPISSFSLGGCLAIFLLMAYSTLENYIWKWHEEGMFFEIVTPALRTAVNNRGLAFEARRIVQWRGSSNK